MIFVHIHMCALNVHYSTCLTDVHYVARAVFVAFPCITVPEGWTGGQRGPSLSINDRADAKNSQLHSRHKGWPLLSAIYVQCIFIFDEVWLSFVDHTSWSPQLSIRKYDQNNWLHMCGSGAVTILRTCNQMVAITAIPLLLKYFVHQSLESQSL